MAYNPVAFDPIGYDVANTSLHIYTWDNSYWIPLKCVIEVYDNTGNTLLLYYDMFNPESNLVKLLECTVSLGLTNTQFTLKFEDGNGVINQNTTGLGNKVLVYAGRESSNLTLLFTGYSENRTPTIIADNVMDYEMSGYGENASLNDLIVNFKRASSQLTDIDDPNFPKRPDSKMVVHELVHDLFEDSDVRVTKDIILKDYLNLDISGISPLVTERLLSIVQSMTEVSQVLNFLTEVTGAYWKIENGKLFFEYPETQHSGIAIKNKVAETDLADSTSYFIGPWQYTDSISKDNGFANRIYTTTSTDTKSVANAMTNQGATALFDRAIAVQVTLLETRVNTIALIMSKIGDPFTPLTDEEEISRGGTPGNPNPPPPTTCPQGYHLSNGQCVPDDPTPTPVCPLNYHFDIPTQRCVPDTQQPPSSGFTYVYNRKWGSNGNGNGQFRQMEGIAVDPEGNIYVGDWVRHDIQKFTSNGTFIRRFGGTVGTPSSANGQFNTPFSIRFDPVDGHMWVADQFNHRLQKINRDTGAYMGQVGPTIPGLTNPSTLNEPEDLDFDRVDHSMYINDQHNSRIIKVDASGNFVTKWQPFSEIFPVEYPEGMSVSPITRNVYITAYFSPRIDIFNPQGIKISSISRPEGTGVGQFTLPMERNYFDREGKFYQLNGNPNPKVFVFDSTGTNSNILAEFGTGPGSADGSLEDAEQLAVDQNFDVYVVDQNNYRVSVFSRTTGGTNPPPTPICPATYHWDPALQVCVSDVVTPPPTEARLYRFVSWGDNDTTVNARTVLNRIMLEPDPSNTWYLFAGDGPYSNDATAWINMMESYFPIGSIKKDWLFMAQGNHEHPESESQTAENQIEAWYPGLNNPDDEGLEWLKGRKVGNTYVIIMNSQDPQIDQVGGSQYNFVQSKLNEAKALRASNAIDWIIVVVHKSWFNLLGSNPAYVTARHAYAAMFRDAQVDFMFHGHNHSYCIWKPIVDIPNNDENTASQAVFTLTSDGKYDFTKDHGTFYIINGNGGHEINPWGENPAAFPNVLYANDQDFGYTVLDIRGKQATIKAKLDNGTVVATVNVTRGTDTTPPITCPTGYHYDTVQQRCVLDVVTPPVCPTGTHWDLTVQQCVPDPPDPGGGGEGQNDSYGIEWKIARGQQFVVDMSRDTADDDRWSGNVTGLRDGVEATFIGKSIGIASDGHFAMKIFGGNHSGSGASSQRWYDLGLRVNGAIQLQWEGPHPTNHDFNLPDSKFFIKNCGKGLENNWIGLKWCVQKVIPNGSPSNGGVRVRMWVDTDPINTTTNRPNNNWRLCLDFIDGVDVQVISPQTYQAPDEQDCEVRRSGTNRHDVYGTGTIVSGSVEGDPGLHVRRMGTSATIISKEEFDRLSIIKKPKPPMATDPNKVVGKPCIAFNPPRSGVMVAPRSIMEVQKDMVQIPEETGFSIDNRIVQSQSQILENVVRGEIRIDNENKPTGPVISQFKVEVGSLSSTADTIFVNDIKVDASVLSPNGKYWLVLLPCGTSYRNTVLWHHDNDLTTLDKYSAFAKGENRNDLSDWHVSRYGPTYTHAIFARLRRIQEYSDPQSIAKFRLKEDMAEADFLDDSLSVAKMMQNILAIRGKPVRKYNLNEVTLPAGKWFTPGQNVTIVDDTGHHEESKNIFAEIQEVSYSWSTSAADSTIGTFKVNVLPVGHLNWHKELFPAGD